MAQKSSRVKDKVILVRVHLLEYPFITETYNVDIAPTVKLFEGY
jgi:hypothetical protein